MTLLEKIKRDHFEAGTVRKAGITIEQKPIDLPTRPGYEWIPIQTVAGGSITWSETSEYNPDLPGTKETPIAFADGDEAIPNYFFIRDGVMKIWVGARHAHPTWDDEDWEPADDWM